MMRIAICDDHQECNDSVRHLLEIFFDENDVQDFQVTEYSSGVDLVAEFHSHKFDFIFLDLHMPVMDGLETAHEIRREDLDVNILFATHMKDKMSMGYKYGAKGFLIKPITQQQITYNWIHFIICTF